MSSLKLFAAAILASVIATPALAQGAVISEPGYCAQFYPTANCNNEGPGNPLTPNWRRDGGGWGAVQAPNSTVGVVRKRPARHRSQS